MLKLKQGKFGQLTYPSVPGLCEQGDCGSTRTGKKTRLSRLVQMHATDKMEDVSKVFSGDIGAVFWRDCASSDSFVSDKDPS